MSEIMTPAICGQAVCGKTICGLIADYSDELRDESKKISENGDNPKVNLVTGRPLLVHPDVSIGANSYRIEVSHIYNPVLENTMLSTFTGIGAGWKLNVQQCIKRIDETNYKFVDGMGYIYALVKYDSSRFHDTEGLGLILTVNNDNSSYLEDEAANIMKFDTYGRLCETISGENSAISKKYVYNETNQLIRIYDARHGVDNPTRYLQFIYDSVSKMLNSIEVHDRAISSYKISEVKYEYLNHRLKKISKTAYATNNTLKSSKVVSIFNYNSNGKLEYVIDSDTLSVSKLEYLNDGKVCKIAKGYTENVNDAQYHLNTTVQYSYLKKENNVSGVFTYETTVTNSKEIQLVYNINSKGVITGIFEKEGMSLKTLSQRNGNAIDSANYNNGTINGSYITNISTEQILYSNNFNVNREGEDSMKNYSFSCWLKTNTTCRYLKLELAYTIDGSQYCSYGNLDCNSNDIWQLVSMPVKFTGKKTIGNIRLSLLGMATETDTLSQIPIQVADCRFAPSEYNELILDYGSLAIRNGEKYNKLNMNFVNNTERQFYTSLKKSRNVNGKTTELYIPHPDNYMTEQDYLRTIKNKVRSQNGTFDLIYCNGTKRIANLTAVKISVDGVTPYELGVENNKTRIGLRSISAENKSITSTTFKFFSDMQRVETYVYLYEDIEDLSSAQSGGSTYKNIDYQGKLWREGDAYRIATIYDYDDYGNIKSITKKYESVPSNPKIIKTEFNYDESSEYLISVFDGYDGVYKTNKKPFDNIVTDKNANYDHLNDSHSESRHLEHIEYDDFNERVISVTSSLYSEQIGKNTLSYEHGRLRTVDDGSSKYGVSYDLATGAITFSVYDTNYDILSQERNIFRRSITGEYQPGQTIITDKYFLDNGQTVDSITVLNKYNQVQTEKYASDNATVYSYKNVSESQSLSPISSVYDSYENVTYNYLYDYENNPVGWNSSGNELTGKKSVSIQQLSSVRTKYVLGNDDPYYVKVNHDSSKVIGSRITQTRYENIPEGVGICNYEYDNLGRLLYNKREDVNLGKYSYQYLTEGDITTTLVSKLTFASSFVTGSSVKTNDVSFDYSYDKRGNITYKKESGTLAYGYSFQSFSNFAYDDANRLKSENGTLIPTYSKTVSLSLKSESDLKVKNSKEIMPLDVPVIPPVINPPIFPDKHFDERRYDYTPSGRISRIYNYYYYQKMDPVMPEKIEIYGSKDFQYDNSRGLLSGYTCSGVLGNDSVSFLYDNYGNRKQMNKNGTIVSYNWTRGNLLTDIRQGNSTLATYRYNHQGVRFYKSESGTETYFYLDGDKILGEDRVTNNTTTKIRYFYDINGLSGFSHTIGNSISYYCYIRDALGNIAMITNGNEVVARYAYDAVGNFKIYDGYGNEAASDSIGYINPFRWKSHYFDQATGFYYINGRYYDKEICSYVDADDIMNILINANTVFGLDRNGIKEDNIVELLPYLYCIMTSNELYKDPTADPEEGISWWDKFKDVIMQAFAAAILVTSFVLSVIPPTSSFGIGLMSATFTGGLISGLISGTTSAIMANNQGNRQVEIFADSFVSGFTHGVITSAIFYCVINIASGLMKLSNKPAPRGMSKISQTPIHELKHTNGKTLSNREFAITKADIRVNGIQTPIKITELNGTKYILDGNHRVAIARKLGFKTVPTEYVSLPYKGFSTIDDIIDGYVEYLTWQSIGGKW